MFLLESFYWWSWIGYYFPKICDLLIEFWYARRGCFFKRLFSLANKYVNWLFFFRGFVNLIHWLINLVREKPFWWGLLAWWMVAMTLITIQSQLEIVYSFSFALLLSSSHFLVGHVFPCWFVERQVLSFSVVGIDMRFYSLLWLAHFLFFLLLSVNEMFTCF